jgi:hypothetical protein
VAKNPRASLAPVGQFTFEWDSKKGLKFSSLRSGKGTVGSALAECGKFLRYELDVPRDLAYVTLDGDLIVRDSATREQKLAALHALLRRAGRTLWIGKRKVPRESIVASGEFAPKPPGAGNVIQIYSDRMDSDNPPNHGSLREFFERVGELTNREIIDTTGSGNREVDWAYHASVQRADEDDRHLSLLLKNLSKQTGLRFERKTLEKEIWVVRNAEG